MVFVLLSYFLLNKIEGFKLHVVHNLKPFVNRIRYTPEVASKPERIEKDLANAKVLATLLEDESAALRAIKSQPKPSTDSVEKGPDDASGQAEETGDAVMADGQVAEDSDLDDTPPERGSDAVERRIEKIMLELREQGSIDLNDEKAVEARKVSPHRTVYLSTICLATLCRLRYLSNCTLLTCALHSTLVTIALLQRII